MNTNVSMYQFIKEQYPEFSNQVVIDFYGKKITFKTLVHLIDNCANRLKELNLQKGDVVTIHLPNVPQSIIAFYALNKLGCISNMVHPKMPCLQLEESMKKVHSDILISYDSFLEENTPKCKSVFCVQCHWFLPTLKGMMYKTKNKFTNLNKYFLFEELLKFGNVYQLEDLNGDDIACYMHSSGTTGQSKVVVHSNLAFNNWVSNSYLFYHEVPPIAKKIYSVLPLFHGSGLGMNIHQGLTYKMTLILKIKFSSKEAVKEIYNKKITHITGVPHMYQLLLNEKKFCFPYNRTLEECYVAGDIVGSELKEKFAEKCADENGNPRNILFEGYGMTEIVTACFSNSRYHNVLKSSGFPLPNCNIGILEQGKIKDRDCQGELCVSTNTMMVKYYDDIYNDQIFTFDNRQWLKTGDYGSIDMDGNVYFCERIKHMIKINGYNVFLSEIENKIKQLDYIKDAVVVPEELGKQKILVLYCVLSSGSENEECSQNLEEFCLKNFIVYERPTKIIFKENLVRNEMGKINRYNLK